MTCSCGRPAHVAGPACCAWCPQAHTRHCEARQDPAHVVGWLESPAGDRWRRKTRAQASYHSHGTFAEIKEDSVQALDGAAWRYHPGFPCGECDDHALHHHHPSP